MKRAPFTAALILFSISLIGWNFPQILPILSIGSLIGAAVFGFVFARSRKRICRDLLFSFCCLFISVLLVFPSVSSFSNTRETWAGRGVETEIRLTEDPRQVSNGMFRCVGEPTEFSQRVMFWLSFDPGVAGDTVCARVCYTLPDDDSAENLSKRIALIALIDGEESVTVREGGRSFASASARVRSYVRRVFSREIGGTEGGFLFSVLTGDKDGLSDSAYRALSDTGMLHIVAVSGLHVSLFVAFAAIFLRRIRNAKVRNAILIAVLMLIPLFSGFTPSVVRACVMSGLTFFGTMTAVPFSSLHRIGIAALLILSVDSATALSLSFQLSFAACLGILLLSGAICDAIVNRIFLSFSVRCGRILRDVIGAFSASVAAFSFTFPILLLRTGTVSVWSLFLSPLILPVLEICFCAALFLLLFEPIVGLFPIFAPISSAVGFATGYGVKFMVTLSSLAADLIAPTDGISPIAALILCGILLFVGAVFLLLPSRGGAKKRRGKFRKAASLILICVSLLTAYQCADSIGSSVISGDLDPGDGVLQIAFSDVGQGNAAVVSLDGVAGVIDCGGTTDPGGTVGDYLYSLGIDEVEFVLISHLHSDHVNGLKKICGQIEIKEILLPYTEGDAAVYATVSRLAADYGIPLTVLEEDTSRKLGGATLHLLTEHLDPTADDQNENSIVAFLEYGNFRAAFTGDITASSESRLVRAYGDNLKCDVLSVPHHGSKSSSSVSFLNRTSPSVAVISVGKSNSYGHPTDQTLNRLTDIGAKIYRTDEDGTVFVLSDGRSMEVKISE